MASRGMEHLFAVKKTDFHGDLKCPSEPDSAALLHPTKACLCV